MSKINKEITDPKIIGLVRQIANYMEDENISAVIDNLYKLGNQIALIHPGIRIDSIEKEIGTYQLNDQQTSKMFCAIYDGITCKYNDAMEENDVLIGFLSKVKIGLVLFRAMNGYKLEDDRIYEEMVKQTRSNTTNYFQPYLGIFNEHKEYTNVNMDEKFRRHLLNEVLPKLYIATASIDITTDEGETFQRNCINLQTELIKDLTSKANKDFNNGSENFSYESNYAYKQLVSQTEMLKRVNRPNPVPSGTEEQQQAYKIRALKTYENKAKEDSSIPVKALKLIGSVIVTGLAAIGGAILGNLIVPGVGAVAGGIAGGAAAMTGSYLFCNRQTDKEKEAQKVAQSGEKYIFQQQEKYDSDSEEECVI